MKKIKKLSVFLLIAAFTFSLTACGSSLKGNSTDTKTAALFHGISEKTGLHMNIEIKQNGENTKLDVSYKDPDMYIKTASKTTGDVIMIINDEHLYILSPAAKTGTKIDMDSKSAKSAEDLEDSMENILDIKDEINDKEFQESTVVIKDTEYNTEDFKDDRSDKDMTRFCYDDNNDLKYIIYKDDGSETIMKINAFDGNVDEGLFKVPSGYDLY